MKNKIINKENISTNSIIIKITTYKEGKLTELPGYSEKIIKKPLIF